MLKSEKKPSKTQIVGALIADDDATVENIDRSQEG